MYRPNPISSYTEEILDLGLAQVGSLTVRHYSRLTQSANQSESRTPLSAFGLYSIDLGGVVLEGSRAQYVLDFLHARRGRTQGFRVRVPSDYQLTQPLYSRYEPDTGTYTCRYALVLPEVSNAGTIYRIYRIIQTRSLTGVITREEKPIFKPRPGSIRLINGATGSLIPTTQWLIDYTSGQILFPGGFPSFPVVPLGEFDIPVRLSEEENPLTLNTTVSKQFVVSSEPAPPIGNILAKGILCEPHVNNLALENLKLVEFVPQSSELAFNGQTAFTGVGNIYPAVNVAFAATCNGNDLQISWPSTPIGTITTHVIINGNLTHTFGSGAGLVIAPSIPATVQLIFLDGAGGVIGQSQAFTSSTVCSGNPPPVEIMFARLFQFNTPGGDGNIPSALLEVSPPPATTTALRVTQAGNSNSPFTIPVETGANYWIRGVINAPFVLSWMNGATVLDTYTISTAYLGPVSGYDRNGSISYYPGGKVYQANNNAPYQVLIRKATATYGYAGPIIGASATYSNVTSPLWGVLFGASFRQVGGCSPSAYPSIASSPVSAGTFTSKRERLEIDINPTTDGRTADLSRYNSIYSSIRLYVEGTLVHTFSTPYSTEDVGQNQTGWAVLVGVSGGVELATSQIYFVEPGGGN